MSMARAEHKGDDLTDFLRTYLGLLLDYFARYRPKLNRQQRALRRIRGEATTNRGFPEPDAI